MVNENVLQVQQKFVKTRKMLDVKKRIEVLKLLRKNIKLRENEIYEALKTDLNKSRQEAYMTEIGIVFEEISYMLKHVRKLAKPKRVHTPLNNFPAKSYIRPMPYGCVLVISPWNYPFMLSLGPIVDAVAAGNSVVLKPSENSAHTSAVLKKIIEETFERGHVDVVVGGRDECSNLLDMNFDYIFFTGSTRVGQLVMQKAAENFTPVTLEMGGKSPCVVDETANIKLAARRMVFGKFLNAGQTCVAPDFVYCHKQIKNELVEALKEEIIKQYTDNPIACEYFPKMISKKQFDNISKYIEQDKIIYGGKTNPEALKIEPTLMNASFEDGIMQEEIFGPIFPILEFENLEEAVENLNKMNKPLAFYHFSTSKKNQKYMEDFCDFGGGCINDTIMHIANPNLPFGGVKHSGIGSYHGKKGFETFTHHKSIVKKANWLDLPLRYQPIGKFKEWLIRLFLK